VIPFHEVNDLDGKGGLCSGRDLEPPLAMDSAELDGWWSLIWSQGPAPPLGVHTLLGAGIGKLVHCIICFSTFRCLTKVRLKESLPASHLSHQIQSSQQCLDVQDYQTLRSPGHQCC
jgi:hypothetical protein